MISILYLLLINFIFSQSIQHNPIKSVKSNQSIEFNIFVDNNNRKIDKAVLMYKNINQDKYLSKEMINIGNYNYGCVVESYFTNSLDINYYFIVEFTDGGMISSSEQKPYLINIIQYEDNYWENKLSSEKIDLLVLNPLPGSIVNSDEIMIAVSLFSLKHIDVNKINILIDDIDITNKAIITENFLSITDLDLMAGKHHVTINITNKFGIQYSPYTWSFIVQKVSKKPWFSKIINQKARYWSSYSQSNIDLNNLIYYDHNVMYNLNLDWLKINSNFKLSSLDDIYKQPKNRYSLTVKNNYVKLDFGDFYPSFNEYILNGNRVRGINLNSQYRFFSINFIKGELLRAIQGDPENNSVYISEVDTIENMITINRDNYTFRQELTALKLGLKLFDKLYWDINLFKAKDNINSVYQNKDMPDAQIEINKKYISDLDNTYLQSKNDSIYTINYKDFNAFYENFMIEIDSINQLTENWSGNKPKDNFIIGSELSLNLDEGKTFIHSGIALSMLNENLWTSIDSIIQLDTLGGDIEDGKLMGTIEIPDNLLSYSDIFELGFDQVPIVPIDLTSQNILNALLNMPSVIYDFDSKFNYGNHSIKYSYDKIGPQFHSLANSYNQSNMKKTSLSDHIKLFNNRLYLFIDITRQDDGLNLIDDNIIKTNTATCNLSLYPGVNLPNINIGFSNRDRSNNSEVYYSEEDDNIIADNRENTYTRNYNFSISDKVTILKKHDINFNMFISDKKDLLLEEKKANDNQYYSPRSYSKNISFNILTKLNDYWSSNVIYNTTNFDSGFDIVDSLNYYQKQYINTIDLSFKYSGAPLLEKIKFGFNNITGTGSQDFIYYSFKLIANHKLLNSIKLSWNYNYQIKWISNNDKYNNTIFKIKLIYDIQ